MEEDVHSVASTTFDSELMEQLGANGFQLKNPDPFFSFIEQHLPIVCGRPTGGEWLCTKGPASSDDGWPETLRSAITSRVGDALPHDAAVVVGDNAMNYGYVLQYGHFIKHVWDFFSIPQHTYVLLEEKKLCFQYTFEEDLFVYRIR